MYILIVASLCSYLMLNYNETGKISFMRGTEKRESIRMGLRKGFQEASLTVAQHRCYSYDVETILSTFFAYPPPRFGKSYYTTNIIKSLNRQFCQLTKNKPSFTNDDSLRKMLYLASRKIVEHRTVRCRNWDMVLAQL